MWDDEMNLGLLERQLKFDEGEILHVYKDSLGHHTAGVGHLLSYYAPIGTSISQAQSDDWLASDIEIVLNDAMELFPRFYDLPEEVQQILGNMLFNLGERKFRGFSTLITYINLGDWGGAAKAMKHSLWAKQVKSRADRLITRMKNVI